MTDNTEPSLDEQIEVIVSIACGAELGLLDDEIVDEDIKRMNATIRANKDRVRKPLKALISDQVAKARKEERSLALMYLHDTNREQDYLRKLDILNGVKNK